MDRKQKAIDEIVRIITNWMGAGPHAIISAQSREAIYDRLFSLMGIPEKEQRKMLNKAWDKGHWERWWHETGHLTKSDVRYRDVTKILKEQEKNDEVD